MILFPKGLQDILIEKSENSRHEVGFIILGEIQENIAVTQIIPITNKSPSYDSFIPYELELSIIRLYCQEEHYNIIGFFHSHSSTAAPSKIDEKYMKELKNIWFIYSKLNKNMFAFKYENELESIQIDII